MIYLSNLMKSHRPRTKKSEAGFCCKAERQSLQILKHLFTYRKSYHHHIFSDNITRCPNVMQPSLALSHHVLTSKRYIKLTDALLRHQNKYSKYLTATSQWESKPWDDVTTKKSCSLMLQTSENLHGLSDVRSFFSLKKKKNPLAQHSYCRSSAL